ncbi:MAG: methylisocitrate lyase [Planctomycetes bacterium]|nr:methylisocitrate lyase [Planctomycetota bacterium]
MFAPDHRQGHRPQLLGTDGKVHSAEQPQQPGGVERTTQPLGQPAPGRELFFEKDVDPAKEDALLAGARLVNAQGCVRWHQENVLSQSAKCRAERVVVQASAAVHACGTGSQIDNSHRVGPTFRTSGLKARRGSYRVKQLRSNLIVASHTDQYGGSVKPRPCVAAQGSPILRHSATVATFRLGASPQVTTSAGERLRQAVAEQTILIPGAFNALVGKLIEQADFAACYLSGAAFSAGSLAMPDVGLFTLSELVQQTTWLTRQVSIPVIVDADTGFGEAINVERTVVELEAAGAAAIQLEDQQLPKRCGHLSGKSLVDTEAMCAKIRAAVSARRDPGTVIIARTDARSAEGFEPAIQRAERYLAAGADWIFPEALTDRTEFAAFAERIDAPLLANMTEFGQSPLLTLEELAELGYAGVLMPVTLMRIAMKAVEAALAVIADEGTQRELLDLMQTRQELYDLLGYTNYEKRDRSYFGGAEGPSQN